VDDSTREFDSWKQSLVTIWQSAKTFFASKYESISRYPIFAYITTAGWFETELQHHVSFLQGFFVSIDGPHYMT